MDDIKDKNIKDNEYLEQLQWIVQPELMSKIQESSEKEKEKVSTITGLSADTINFSNILDSKLAHKGLTIKDIQNG